MARVGRFKTVIKSISLRSSEAFEKEVNGILENGIHDEICNVKIESINVTFVKNPEGGGYTLYQAVLSGTVFVEFKND